MVAAEVAITTLDLFRTEETAPKGSPFEVPAIKGKQGPIMTIRNQEVRRCAT